MIYDFRSWAPYSGFAEGSGRSEKIWLINEQTKIIGLFKFPKSSNTTEHVSEKLAFEIATEIGLPCGEIVIGTYKGRIGSMSFLINQKNEVLEEGISYISSLYPFYESNDMYDPSLNEYYSLEMIMKSIQAYNLENELLKVLIFDYLIGNKDRHQNNWGIIKSKDDMRLSPIYDNGSSLCCYIEESKVLGFLGNDKLRFHSLVDNKSTSIIRIDKKSKKMPTHLSVLEYLHDNFYDSTKDFVETIRNTLTNEVLDDIIDERSEGLLSNNKRILIKEFLKAKISFLNRIY